MGFPRHMPRKVYHIADIHRTKTNRADYLPGQSKDGINTPITPDMFARIKLLICYGKSIRECSDLFCVPESKLRAMIRRDNGLSD